MPTGPGDDILNALDAGKADDAIMKQFSLNGDQLNSFKSLHYGLSNQKVNYNEINDLFPELKSYFKEGGKTASQQPSNTTIEKPDFTKPVHEKAISESTSLPGEKQVKQSVDTAHNVESLQQKFDRGAKESIAHINNALISNDDVINTMIKQGRYKVAKEEALNQYVKAPKSDMPMAARLAEARNLLNPQETKPWEQPVSPEEIAEKKELIQSKEDWARNFINQISAQKPQEAKDLQHSMYMLDATQRMKADPNIAIKVNNNLKEIKEGKLQYDAYKQRLTKPEGFFQSLVTGVKEHARQMDNYDLFQGKDEDVINLLEKRRASFDPDAPVPVPAGNVSEVGQMMGMEWKPLLKGFAVGAATAPFDAEGAAPYITAAINSPEYYKRGYSTALEESYDEFRRQGKSPEESLKLSREQARTEGVLGAAEGFVSSFIGGRIGLKELPKFNVTGGFKNAVNGFIKQAAHGIGETSVEGISDGLVAGLLQERKDVAAEEKGLFRDSEKNVSDNIKGEVTFAFAMAGMTKLGKGLISPETYNKIKYWITKQNPEAVKSSLGQMVMNGQISKEDADNITKEVAEQKAIDEKIPDDIKDVSRQAMIEKIKQRQDLEKQLESTDEALHPEIKEKIKILNEEIAEHSKHKKTENESETKAETQADAETQANGAGIEPGPEKTSQPVAETQQGVGGESAPVADMHYTNPEGTSYVLRGEDLYHVAKDGKETKFSEKAMQSPATQELIAKIKEANQEIKPSENNQQEKVNFNGVKYSDIFIGGKGLQDILDDNKLSEEEKDKVREIFRRHINYFKFDEGAAKKWHESLINPEDITDVADLSHALSLSKESDFYHYNDRNYENVKDHINYIITNPHEYSPKVVKAVKEIKSLLENASTGNRLFAIDLNKELGITNKNTKQNAVQKQSPRGIHVPTSPSNSQALGAGNESQGAVNETSTGSQNEVSAANQEFYETSIGATPSSHTGRIKVSPIVSSKPGKRISQIIKDVSAGLKQRMFFIKPGRGAGGYYAPGSKGIVVRYNGDLSVTAHELGHSLDDHFDIFTKAQSNQGALQEMMDYSNEQLASTPSANHPNPQKYILQEGFAEWLRHFVVNPKDAEAFAPNLTALYKANVSKEFQEVIQQFSDDVRTWAGAIGRDVELSNVEYEPSQKGTLAKLFKAEETNNEFSINWFDRLAAKFLNPLAAFEKGWKYAKGIRGLDEVIPENDPIILSRVLYGVDGKFGEVLKTGMINGRGEVLRAEGGTMLYDDEGRLIKSSGTVKNLEWLLAPFDNTDEASIKRDMKDTIDYMVAERTVELSKKFERGHVLTGLGAGVVSDFSVAQRTLSRLEKGDPERMARIQEAAKRYREFADDTLQYAVDKGRLSQEQYDLIKENNVEYVALQRVMEAEPGEEIIVFKPTGGKTLGGKAEITHTIKGSTKEIINPYIPLLDTLYKTIRESDRNEVLQAFRNMLVDKRGMNEGAPKRLSDIGIRVKDDVKGAIPIFIEGKLEKWKFQSDIHNQLLNLDKEGYRVPKILSKPGELLRWFTTHAPQFAVKNWIKDTGDRLIKSTTWSGLTDLYGSPEDWHAIARHGGLNSGMYLKNKDAYYGLLTEAMSVMAKDKKFIIVNPDLLKHAWHKYEDLLYKGETSNRVAEYRSALKQAQNKGLDNYNASLYAAFKSRDLIDFAIMGTWMRVANQIVPFSNAAVQGLRSGAISLKNNPWGFLARMTIYSIMPGIASWLWNHRNDEDAKLYEEKPAYERDMFWGFRVGPNKWVMMPKPYELALPQAGIDRLLSYKYAGNDKAFEGYGKDVLKLLLPFDEGNLAGPYQGIYEGISNYDFFRERNIIPVDEDPLELARRHTETGSRLGQLLQNISTWDARKWDHLIKRQFSYAGNITLKLSDIGREDKRNQFDLTDTGLFKRSPAYNAVSVQDMIKFAKGNDLTKSPAYKEFNGIVGRYFAADTEEDRENVGKEMIDYSKALLKEWEESNIKETLQKRFEAKKAAQQRR